MKDSNQEILGQCFCGKVQFKIELPIEAVVHCHCSICRRIHGAAFVTWVQVLPKNLYFLQGEDDLQKFQTSEVTYRSFCSSCGTSLMWQNEYCPHRSISRASITSPLDVEPNGHYFYDTHVDWINLKDQLPRYGQFLVDSLSWEKYSEKTEIRS